MLYRSNVYRVFVKLDQVECYDFDADGDHDLIGGFTTTVLEMMQAATQPVCCWIIGALPSVL